MTVPPTSQRAFTALALLRTAMLGALAVGLVALVAPPLAGWRVLTEQTGSMAPTLHPGDVVVVRPVSPLDVRAGDVVTFPSPESTGKLITHRVVSTIPRAGTVTVVTRGDANNDSERWAVDRDGRIGRAVYRIPAVGRALALTRLPMVRLLFLVVPTLLLALFELAKIWRRDAEASASDHGPIAVASGGAG